MSALMIAVSCLILVGHSIPGAHLAVDEAERFLGTWTAMLEGPAGPVSFRIDISDDHSRVVASVSSDLMSTGKSEEITKHQQGITLRYTAELWGYSAPVELTLVPVRDGLEVDCWVMQQFQLRGLARRASGANRLGQRSWSPPSVR
jgi:hypothetical protein